MEQVWPEPGSKIGTTKHGAHGIAYSLMRVLNRTIHVGRVRSANLHCVACTLKEINDSSTTTKVITGIEANKSILDTVVKTILQQPLVEVVDRRSLGAERPTPDLLAMVILN
jgi:hypothetical protein